MSKKKNFIKVSRNTVWYLKLLFLILIPPLLLGSFLIYYSGKIYPGVSIDGVDVGGIMPDVVTSLLKEKVVTPETLNIVVRDSSGRDESYIISTKDISFAYEPSESSLEAFSIGRSGNALLDAKSIFDSISSGVYLNLAYRVDKGSLNQNIALISDVISNRPEYPKVDYINGKIQVFPGKAGEELMTSTLSKEIITHIERGDLDSKIVVSTKHIDPTLSSDELQLVQERAEKLLKRELVLTYKRDTFVLNEERLIGLIDPVGDYDQIAVSEFAFEVSDSLNREPQNPVFVQENSKVAEFEPALPGIEVSEKELIDLINAKLAELEKGDVSSLGGDIPLVETFPKISTDEINDLGINELIGRGTSQFRGSIASRVHNIAVATSRLNGTLIPPNAVFSFNQAIGDISVYTGYKQSYIISGGATILGDGGGVCQVSTTTFRAALDAGLPIVARRAHAYRVGYYEQDSKAGLDATIYSPTVDLKFRNDTPGYILVQAKADTKNLNMVVELYGTSDGRVSTVSTPVVYGSSPPPEDLYIDDPNLPAGEIKQIDYAAWGAKSSFNYKVTRGDEVLQDRAFYSNYQPWQAKFLRGTGPAN